MAKKQEHALDWPAIHERIQTIVDDLIAARDGISRKALCEELGLEPTNMTKFLGADGARQLAAESIGILAGAAGRTTDWVYYGRDGQAGGVVGGAAPQGLQHIPHDKIHPWEKNPRKHFDDAAIAELADNMLDQARTSGGTGMLQNIVVRPHPKQDDQYQIVSGERRWRAIALNIDRMHLAVVAPVLCMIRDVGDADALAIAIAENVERRDMSPLEEARAYRDLQDLRAAESGAPVSAGQIAEELGVNKRTLQQRLKLLTLADEVQNALEEGHININQARELARAPHEMQLNALDAIQDGDHGWKTAEEIHHSLFRDKVPVTRAMDGVLADYQAKGGALLDDGKYFDDTALFGKVQTKAAKAAAKELETTAGDVRFYERGKQFQTWNHSKRPDHPKAFSVVEVCHNWAVQITHDWVTDADAQAARRKEDAADRRAPDGDAAPADPVTKGHLEHARKRKSLALQRALAADPEAAMRVVIIALLDPSFSASTIRNGDWNDRVVAIDPGVADEIETLSQRQARSDWMDYPDGRFHDLGQLTGAALHEALANVVASTVHSPCDWGGLDRLYGDDKHTMDLAAHLSVPGREAELGLADPAEGDLDGIRKAGLLPILLDLDGPESAFDYAKTGMKDLREAIARRTGRSDQGDVEAVSDYVLPSLHFATAEDGRRRNKFGNRAVAEADADAAASANDVPAQNPEAA